MRDEKYITKIIAASLLGDGYVGYNKTKNAAFEVHLIAEHKDHLEYLDKVISPIVPSSYYTRTGQKFTIDGKTSIRKDQIRLRTKSHPFFNKFRDRMYPNGHKVVDPHYLTLLDWEFLAVWYMQDGYMSAYYSQKKYPQYRVGLATNGFSYADNHFLRINLKEKLGLDWTVTNHTNTSGTRSYKLILVPKQIDYFCENIKQYIQPSFEYKINKTTTLERIDALHNKVVI